MKAVAKCLTVLALLAVLALAYVHYASRLIVRYAGVNVASCADYQQTFDTIRDYAQRGTADVTVFTEACGKEASACHSSPRGGRRMVCFSGKLCVFRDN